MRLPFTKMYLKNMIITLFAFVTAEEYLYAEDLRNMHDMIFSCKSHQSFYVIKEDGPLGYLPFLLMRTGTLGNVVSLIHTLGNNLDKDGIRGFNALFGKLGVEREGESSKICIGNFLIYDCKEKTFTHKNSSGRFFLDTAIDILKEGYEGFFDISDKNEYTEAIGRDVIPFSWYKVSNLYGSSKAMDLVDRLINSRYFLLHIYLYTTQAKSRSEFRALYNDIFSRMAEEENGSNTILNGCFMIKKTNGEEYGTQNQFEPLLISSEQVMRFPSLGAFDGYWVRADKSTSSYRWGEGFIYMLTHCLCKGFDLEIEDFINDGDEDFQTLLEHVINIGYVSEFNSSFRKKCTRLLEEKINRNSCFSVNHKKNLEVQSGFINILGMLGNFFVRFLNELGLEGKSVSDLKKEYEELQRISDLPVREEGDIVGRFTGLATKMIRSMEKEVLIHMRRNKWWHDRYGSPWINIDFGGLRLSRFDGKVIGKITFNYPRDPKLIIICEEVSMGLFPHMYPQIKVSGDPHRGSIEPVSTGIPILDIFAEIYRQIILQDLCVTKLASCSVMQGFKSRPITTLIRGGLAEHRHMGYLLLNSMFKYSKATNAKDHEPIHRRIIEMIFNNFNTNEYDGPRQEFIQSIKSFIEDVPLLG